jgi:GxxExxY protein
MTENEIATIIVDCCYKLHTALGPGLLESVYEEVLAHELIKRNVPMKRQESVAVVYDGLRIDMGFRADIIVDDKVIVEIKSVEALARVHYKQLLTYLKLSNLRLGLLVNFNQALIKDGIKRVVNKLE